ncbi:cytochrome P450 [Anopheles sinensis]|uniref:Cytochrome P450 n=1 Tax=Anopheles sinensis TaxID=74873 RepID=A0A084VMQ2_ANOSI|nr:cytochrome P450 [Anopheles sinensis]
MLSAETISVVLLSGPPAESPCQTSLKLASCRLWASCEEDGSSYRGRSIDWTGCIDAAGVEGGLGECVVADKSKPNEAKSNETAAYVVL